MDLSKKGLSANTVNGIISVLKSSLRRAVLLGVTDKEFTIKQIKKTQFNILQLILTTVLIASGVNFLVTGTISYFENKSGMFLIIVRPSAGLIVIHWYLLLSLFVNKKSTKKPPSLWTLLFLFCPKTVCLQKATQA